MAHLNPLTRLQDEHPRLWIKTFALWASEGGYELLESIGFSPDEVRQAVEDALDCGAHDQAKSICQALLLAPGEWGSCSTLALQARPNVMLDLNERWGKLHEAPENAKRWLILPNAQAAPFYLWNLASRLPAQTFDEPLVAALRRRSSEAARGGDRVPCSALVWASPEVIEAICEGVADAGNWEAAEDLARSAFDPRAAAAAPAALAALERMARESSAPDSDRALRVVCVAAQELGPEQAARLGKALADKPANLARFKGLLPSPADVVVFGDPPLPQPLRWLGALSSPSRLRSMPDAPVLTLGELMSHWEGPLGRRVAELANAEQTSRSRSVVDMLRQIGAACDQEEVDALCEALALAGAARPTATSTKPRL